MSAPSQTAPEQWLLEHGAKLKAAWLEKVFEAYADEFQALLRGQGNPFANPAGAIFRDAIERLFAVVMDGSGMEHYREILLPIVRLKAVQEMPPSEALAFLPFLKTIIEAELPRSGSSAALREAIATIESRLDLMLLLAFDVYTECREKIYRVRVNEIKRNMGCLAVK